MGVDKLLIAEAASTQAQESVYGVARLQVEKVLDGTALGCLVTLRYVVAMEPIATAKTREDEHRLVHRRGIYKLGEVFLPGVGTL